MGANSQDAIVLMITDPSDSALKRVEFETGICSSCRQVGYCRSETMGHGVGDIERKGLCNACFEKKEGPSSASATPPPPPPPSPLSSPSVQEEAVPEVAHAA